MLSSETIGAESITFGHYWVMAADRNYKHQLGARIKRILKMKDCTYEKLADELKITRSAVGQWAAGKAAPKQENLVAIAKWAGVNFNWLATGAGKIHEQKSNDSSSYRVRIVRVQGEVQAGVWYPETPINFYNVDGDPSLDKYKPGWAVDDPEYADLRQFALRIVGNSINKLAPDGHFAVCVNYDDARSSIQDGDVVVVEQRRAGLTEATIKIARGSAGKWELWPHSTDIEHQKPIKLNAKDNRDLEQKDTEVEVVALVIGFYGPQGKVPK